MGAQAKYQTEIENLPPIFDSHFHIWDKSTFQYSWLRSVPELNRDFVLSDYLHAIQPLKVLRSIFVEAYVDRELGSAEALWALSQANENPIIAGVVGAVYLEDPAAAGDLARLKMNPKFKGIRRLLDEEPDDNFPASESLIEGIKRLADLHLPFDICIRHTQLQAAIEMVKRCPDTRFVLDHCGKPDIRCHKWQPWADQIHAIAAHRNVYCKISGLVTEAGPENLSPVRLRPYIQHIIRTFGFRRVMFGTDWPICSLVTTTKQWLELLLESVGKVSDGDLEWLFWRTCKEFYKL
jgi:predicted TIM-barrel fold metal-dependent hydrolase